MANISSYYINQSINESINQLIGQRIFSEDSDEGSSSKNQAEVSKQRSSSSKDRLKMAIRVHHQKIGMRWQKRGPKGGVIRQREEKRAT